VIPTWWLGYKFSDAIELFGTYGQALDTKTWTGEKDKDSGAVYTQLTMLYNFTKKLTLYATYAKVENEAVAAYNFFINGAATPSKASAGSIPANPAWLRSDFLPGWYQPQLLINVI
jgi:hypothetical protein